MPTTFSTFQRLKDKGIAAYRKGDYATARPYLIQAAECMIELAESAKTTELRRQQEAYATELIDLAKDCSKAVAEKRPARARATDEGDSTTDATEWIVRDKPDVGFDDIAGLEDAKAEIRLKMIHPLQHPKLAEKYGIDTGGGLLLYGPPGTGKTMLGRAIAHEIDATFFVISPAQILSKWVGEAEQNVRKLFDAAKAEDKSIIFIDEIEALVPKRKTDSSSVMQRVVPQILQELEGFDRSADRSLLFVGATNRPWMLDEAIMRPGRFDALIHVPLPDAPARYRLLELYLVDKRPIADDIDLGQLCDMLEGYSGADVRNIAELAARRPFMEAVGGAETRPISMQDLLAVIERTPPSVRKNDLTRFEEFARQGT